MMLAVAGDGARVVGVDLADKVPVARRDLQSTMGPHGGPVPFGPFAEDSFELVGGDAYERLEAWAGEGRNFDVVYSGCSMDPETDQLKLFLGRMKPSGAAVFNLGNPGEQGMYFVADGGKRCELLMRVNFMMCQSPRTPRSAESVPLEAEALGSWVREHVF